MKNNNKINFFGLSVLSLSILGLSGCSSYEPITPAYRINEDTVCQQYRKTTEENMKKSPIVYQSIDKIGVLENQKSMGTGKVLLTDGEVGSQKANREVIRSIENDKFKTKCFKEQGHSYNKVEDYNPNYK